MGSSKEDRQKAGREKERTIADLLKNPVKETEKEWEERQSSDLERKGGEFVISLPKNFLLERE